MADADFDYALALSLQERFNQESKIQSKEKKIPAEVLERKYDPKGIVDEHWELTDPNPNIHDLYVQFDAMFFGGALNERGVEVRWSNKMTLCAGLCCYEGRGCLCSIRLSLPLLKLRPRKDLVQTLLHEMIHAYLFVAENNKDHSAHGPQFLQHMHRINKAAGTNITVYHSFHDEVNEYRQHWWKCNGPCQRRPPFFGMVKRVMNRAPSPKDHWWAEHQRTCGGTYIKIKEPEGYKKGKSQKGSTADVNRGNTASRNSKNIKDMFNGVSGQKDGTAVGPGAPQAIVSSTRSVSVSHVKPFEGRGQRLRDTIDVDAEPGPSSSLSARDRMLAAAEKRMKESQHKGKRKKGSESGTPNHDIRKYGIISTGHHSPLDQGRPSSPKKSKLSINLSDSDCCILLDPESPPSSGSVGSAASRDPSVTIIDLNDPCRDGSTESLPSPWDNSVIEVDAESSDGDGLKTCPVCGRSDIPAVIINTHIAFCLDEEAESTIVDDHHL